VQNTPDQLPTVNPYRASTVATTTPLVAAHAASVSKQNSLAIFSWPR